MQEESKKIVEEETDEICEKCGKNGCQVWKV